MDSGLNQLHFVLIPLMSPGHLIPMTDMARLLAQHGTMVSIVTTPLNAIKFNSIIERASKSGLQVQILTLHFPAVEAGLPEGCENMDQLPTRIMIKNFYEATNMLQKPFENLLQNLQPPASCIVSGKNLGWTVETSKKFKIPRIFFDGMGCFSFSCTHRLETCRIHEGISSSEPFLVPGLPHRVEVTKAKLPENLNPGSADLTEVRNKMRAAEFVSDGIVVNTFEELEGDYVKEYIRVKGGKVWCIGPVSGYNKSELDKVERGDVACIDVNQWLKWLDSWEPGSVIHACLGSICGLKPWQLKELALGLEASNRPFIWVIRGGEKSEGLEKWILEEGFEDRTNGRGLVIHGWAPQLLILSHPAIGGFLTHCGWNSTLEGIGTAGVPLLTCPLFAEQFFNEILVVEVLGTGVSVGVQAAVTWGLEDKSGLVMKRENVKEAIAKLMDKGEEAEARRKKARELGEMAKRAIEEGGSSYHNMEMLIQYVKAQLNLKLEKHTESS